MKALLLTTPSQLTCVLNPVSAAGCSLTDVGALTSCFCTNTTLLTSVSACVRLECEIPDQVRKSLAASAFHSLFFFWPSGCAHRRSLLPSRGIRSLAGPALPAVLHPLPSNGPQDGGSREHLSRGREHHVAVGGEVAVFWAWLGRLHGFGSCCVTDWPCSYTAGG